MRASTHAERQRGHAPPLPATLSINQAARYLGVSRPTVERAMLNGQLPFIMLGTRRRVPVAHLRRMLEGPAHDDPVAS